MFNYFSVAKISNQYINLNVNLAGNNQFINIEIEDAVNFAKNSLEPELNESLKDIYTDLIERDNLV